jgi:hypothetical protein
MFKRIVAIFFVVLFTGCAAKGPTFQQIQPSIPAVREGYGRLYFMNPGRPHARVAVDKNQIGECKFGAFFWEDVPAGAHVVTLDNSGDFGAWDEPIEVSAGQEQFILIKPRRGQAIANGLFGPLGLLAEAAIATEGKSGSFQAEILPADQGAKVRSELVYFREGAPLGDSSAAAPPVVAPAKTPEVADKVSPASVKAKPSDTSHSVGGCSVEQVLSMKSAALSDSQIRAACK